MAWVALAEESTQQCFGLRIFSNQCGVALRMRNWGQDRSGTTGGEKSSGRSFSPTTRSWRKSGAMVAETEGSELGGSPGPDVELLRG